ncbi:restriction endonuclease subunit S [Dietzia aerolata]
MSIAATVGIPVITGVPTCIHDGFVALENLKVDQRFLLYLLKASEGMLRESGQSGSQMNVNTDIVKSLHVCIPVDLGEQERIAAALWDIDDLIAALERLIAKKQAIKRGMTQQLLTGGARLPGFSSSWEEVTWSDVVTPQPGNSQIKGRLSPRRNVKAQYPGFSASGQDVWLPTWDVEGDGVVISAVGSRCGRAFLATGRWSAIANTHILLPRSNRLDASFAMLYFNDEAFWIKGGSGQPFVQVGSSLSKRVKLPPLDEQRAIMNVLGDLDWNVNLLRSRLVKARAIKAGMMQQLLTGRARLPVGDAT